MPAPTKAYVAKLRAKLTETCSTIFGCASDTRTPFLACLEIAPPSLRARYEAEREAVDAAERAAVATGRAWRDAYGSIVWNK